MQNELTSRIVAFLQRPLPMKPQTERQLGDHLSGHNTDVHTFLLCASQVLEDFELEILFGPIFTPTLDDRAEFADLLFHWRPTAGQLQEVLSEVCRRVPHATVRLPDGSEAKLTLHEVLVERFVRLLRLDHGPDALTAAALRDALPPELWSIGTALLCEHGMSPRHQAWLATFLSHAARRGDHEISRGWLEDLVRFIAGQPDLDRDALLAAAEALQRATQGSAAYAAGGHAYWSPDVAQHHHYRGEGRVDQARLEQEQARLGHITTILQDLRAFQQVPG